MSTVARYSAAAAHFAGDVQVIFREMLEDQRHARFLSRIPNLVIREIREVLDGQGVLPAAAQLVRDVNGGSVRTAC